MFLFSLPIRVDSRHKIFVPKPAGFFGKLVVFNERAMLCDHSHSWILECCQAQASGYIKKSDTHVKRVVWDFKACPDYQWVFGLCFGFAKDTPFFGPHEFQRYDRHRCNERVHDTCRSLQGSVLPDWYQLVLNLRTIPIRQQMKCDLSTGATWRIPSLIISAYALSLKTTYGVFNSSEISAFPTTIRVYFHPKVVITWWVFMFACSLAHSKALTNSALNLIR